MAKAMTDVAGSSGCYLGGVVTYTNELKQELLGVRRATLRDHGAVSEETAREMTAGALARLGGGMALSVTGIAGPGGAVLGKPVGTVWFGWAWRACAQQLGEWREEGLGPVSEYARSQGQTRGENHRQGQDGAADENAQPDEVEPALRGILTTAVCEHFEGDRDEVGRQSVARALAGVLQLLARRG